MGVFDSDIETAKELIEESGELSSVRRLVPGAPDPAKPWQSVPPVETVVPVSAVWLNYNTQSGGETYVAGTLIKAGDKKVLIAAKDISDLTSSDQLIRADGEVYKIINARLLDPNGQKILWIVQAQQ